MSINETGFWEGLEGKKQHTYDYNLGEALVSFFNPFSIKG